MRTEEGKTPNCISANLSGGPHTFSRETRLARVWSPASLDPRVLAALQPAPLMLTPWPCPRRRRSLSEARQGPSLATGRWKKKGRGAASRVSVAASATGDFFRGRCWKGEEAGAWELGELVPEDRNFCRVTGAGSQENVTWWSLVWPDVHPPAGPACGHKICLCAFVFVCLCIFRYTSVKK